jgi:hypothetical protein
MAARNPPPYSATQFSPHVLREQLTTIEDTLDSLSSALRILSLDIHDHPEIAWTEKRAHGVLCDFMEARKFKVTRHAYGIETAWEAVFEYGKGGVTIGLQSEMVRENCRTLSCLPSCSALTC